MNLSGPLGAVAAYEVRAATAVCTISRASGDPVWDGTEYVPDTIEVYSGPCSFQPLGQNEAQVVQAGDRPVSLAGYRMSVPATVDARVDDDVTVSTSRDPLVSSRRFRVTDVPLSEAVTVRHLVLEEQT